VFFVQKKILRFFPFFFPFPPFPGQRFKVKKSPSPPPPPLAPSPFSSPGSLTSEEDHGLVHYGPEEGWRPGQESFFPPKKMEGRGEFCCPPPFLEDNFSSRTFFFPPFPPLFLSYSHNRERKEEETSFRLFFLPFFLLFPKRFPFTGFLHYGIMVLVKMDTFPPLFFHFFSYSKQCTFPPFPFPPSLSL